MAEFLELPNINPADLTPDDPPGHTRLGIAYLDRLKHPHSSQAVTEGLGH